MESKRSTGFWRWLWNGIKCLKEQSPILVTTEVCILGSILIAVGLQLGFEKNPVYFTGIPIGILFILYGFYRTDDF